MIKNVCVCKWICNWCKKLVYNKTRKIDNNSLQKLSTVEIKNNGNEFCTLEKKRGCSGSSWTRWFIFLYYVKGPCILQVVWEVLFHHRYFFLSKNCSSCRGSVIIAIPGCFQLHFCNAELLQRKPSQQPTCSVSWSPLQKNTEKVLHLLLLIMDNEWGS